jgi:hypothetical protein
MKKIKDDIPTAETLQVKLHATMKSGLTDFVKTTNARRIAVRASIRFAIVSVLFILAIAVFLYMAHIDLNTFLGKIITTMALLWVTVLLISGKSWFIGSTLLAREINMALVPILADVMNRTLLYTYNENARDSVTELINDSSLLPEDVQNLQVKNVYTVFSDCDMRVHEVEFDQTTNGPGSKVVKAHATFIDVNMAVEHAAATMLASTGSRFGFSQQGLVARMQENSSFQSIELQDSKLKAFTTDSAIGNSFLTPEVLQVMCDWKNQARVNIRVMRRETKLYILVPAGAQGTTYTSTSTKPDAIERYASVIAQPIWRALLLAEEVNT